MDKPRKNEKKQRITLVDLIVRKDPKGGFGRVVHAEGPAERDRATAPDNDESQESRANN